MHFRSYGRLWPRPFFELYRTDLIQVGKAPSLPSVHRDDIVHLVSTLPGLLGMERIIKTGTVKGGDLCLQNNRHDVHRHTQSIKFKPGRTGVFKVR